MVFRGVPQVEYSHELVALLFGLNHELLLDVAVRLARLGVGLYKIPRSLEVTADGLATDDHCIKNCGHSSTSTERLVRNEHSRAIGDEMQASAQHGQRDHAARLDANGVRLQTGSIHAEILLEDKILYRVLVTILLIPNPTPLSFILFHLLPTVIALTPFVVQDTGGLLHGLRKLDVVPVGARVVVASGNHCSYLPEEVSRIPSRDRLWIASFIVRVHLDPWILQMRSLNTSGIKADRVHVDSHLALLWLFLAWHPLDADLQLAVVEPDLARILDPHRNVSWCHLHPRAPDGEIHRSILSHALEDEWVQGLHEGFAQEHVLSRSVRVDLEVQCSRLGNVFINRWSKAVSLLTFLVALNLFHNSLGCVRHGHDVFQPVRSIVEREKMKQSQSFLADSAFGAADERDKELVETDCAL
mmetsp:Transcript_94796/g.164499  ORF Transcript_94796/g.164499 Transcript_94796/m.164499 type:complete len:415 (+) Transcript_94796:2668-3912(+)